MDAIIDLLTSYGYWGMLLAAFLAGSFFPFSSEAVMVGLMAAGLDPWPLVVLEAKAAGCEVIMSDRCGNRFELGAHVVRFGDVDVMARAMLSVERGPACAGAEQPLDFWSCAQWARRTLSFAEEIS